MLYKEWSNVILAIVSIKSKPYNNYLGTPSRSSVLQMYNWNSSTLEMTKSVLNDNTKIAKLMQDKQNYWCHDD